jgi:hypothetical protein
LASSFPLDFTKKHRFFNASSSCSLADLVYVAQSMYIYLRDATFVRERLTEILASKLRTRLGHLSR